MEKTFTIKKDNNVIGILTSTEYADSMGKSIAIVYNIENKTLRFCEIEFENSNIKLISKNNLTLSNTDTILSFLREFRCAVMKNIPECFIGKFNDDGKLNDKDGGIEETYTYFIEVNKLYINDYSQLNFKWKNISIKIDKDITIHIGRIKMIELEDCLEENEILNMYRYHQIQRRIETILDIIEGKDVKFDNMLF